MKPIVIITGATGGLGTAFSVECARRGWNLFLTDIGEERLNDLALGLSSTYGIEVYTFPSDLTSHESRNLLIAKMKTLTSRFTGLINVAGLDYEGPFTERTTNQIETIIRLNIEANLFMTNEVLQLRNPDELFHIINVSSMAAFYPMPIKAMYSSSKRFLLNFSLALRQELKKEHVSVTALCPSGMRTNENCIKSIDAQGLLGNLTTKDVGYVAYHTLRHALKGHAIYIPGRLNQGMHRISMFLSPNFIASLIGWRWNSIKSKNVEVIYEE